MMQYNLKRACWLLPGTVFNIGYNGSTGVHLFTWINANPSLYYGELTGAALTAAQASETTPKPPGRGRRAR